MTNRGSTGTEFIEGYALLFMALWLMGALFVGTMVTLGVAKLGDASVSAGSNQTPVGEMPTQ